MSQTRYCSTCGALLSPGAVLCGECGARFQDSPFHKKATEAPSAWGAAPIPRATAPQDAGSQQEDEPAVEIISRESLEPPTPGMTALRPGADQYDRTMAAPNLPLSSPAASEEGKSTTAGRGELAYPLDGCVPAPILKRLLAYVLDSVVGGIVSIPVSIGALLISLNHGQAGLAAQILVGIGVILPLVFALVLLWLEGTKGVTIGKAALGLRTARWSCGGPIGIARAFGRAILVALPLVGLVMAASVLLDPRRTGRGFHDRAVDAVVLDVRAGRNGVQPRPDDFERQSAEHFVPRHPVEVHAHENLLATPGAAWGVGSPDPVADPVASGAAPHSAWAAAEQPSAAADPGPSSWAPPAGSDDGWTSSGAAPAPADPAPAPSPGDAPVSSWDAPAAVPVAVDEDDDRTRISRPAPAPAPVPRLRLVLDEGSIREAEAPAVIGRNPSPEAGRTAVAVPDATRSISKTHVLLEAREGRIVVTDLGSTNGTALVGPGQERTELPAHEPAELPAGAHIALGERTLTVEVMS